MIEFKELIYKIMRKIPVIFFASSLCILLIVVYFKIGYRYADIKELKNLEKRVEFLEQKLRNNNDTCKNE